MVDVGVAGSGAAIAAASAAETAAAADEAAQQDGSDDSDADPGDDVHGLVPFCCRSGSLLAPATRPNAQSLATPHSIDFFVSNVCCRSNRNENNYNVQKLTAR